MISDASARRPVLDDAPPDDGRPETGSAPVPAVFVDPSGRRRRLVRRAGMVAGALLVLYLGALGVGVATGAGVPLTRWDEPSDQHRVDGTRRPSPKPAKAEPGGERRGNTNGTRGAGGSGGRAGGARVAAPTGTETGATGAAPTRTARPSTPVPTVTVTTDRPGNAPASPPRRGHDKKPR